MRFDPNPKFIEELESSEQMAPVVERLGRRLQARIIANASEPDNVETGHFERSISGSLRRAARGAWFFRVQSDDPGAASIEFGDDDQEGQRPFGRAVGENIFED